jgi:predicted aspartyl protease
LEKPEPQKIPTLGFTTKHSGRARVLQNEIVVTEAYDPQSSLPKPLEKKYLGIWDTGATGIVISSKIINELNLKPSGKIICKAVGSGGKVNEYETDTFSINIGLPNKLILVGITAAKGDLGDADALIGMDVICSGDFAVTNHNGKTLHSFRFPSKGEIDFVQEIDNEKAKLFAKVGRNDPCPCNSGKKFKHCHGK